MNLVSHLTVFFADAPTFQQPKKGNFRHTPEAIADMTEAFTRGKGVLTEAERDRIAKKHMITRQQVNGWVVDRARRWGLDGSKLLIRRIRSVVNGKRTPFQLKMIDLPLYNVLGVEQMKQLVGSNVFEASKVPGFQIKIIICAMAKGPEKEKLIFPLIKISIPSPPFRPEDMKEANEKADKQFELIEKVLAEEEKAATESASEGGETGGETESGGTESPITDTDDSESISDQ